MPVVTAIPASPPKASAASATIRSASAVAAHIADQRDRLSTPDPPDRGLGPSGIATGDRDPSSFGGQHRCRGQTHPGGAADDQIAAIAESEVHQRPPEPMKVVTVQTYRGGG